MKTHFWVLIPVLFFTYTARAQAEGPLTAVFNFGMTTSTPEWKWLEKGMADMLTNDLVASEFSVVARDEMQALAMVTQWKAEEMMRDREVWPVAKLKEALKIDLVVSGIYEVEPARKRIVLQAKIVHLDQAKVLTTLGVTGGLDEVLELRKRLSKDVVSFLADYTRRGVPRNFEEIRPAPWSESVDALRAHYEGIDLYDQGLYPEAWLKFRQARRTTPDFADAIYWAGKMEYFSDRYEHARITLNQFLTYYGTHPMAGAAVREYTHTFERFTRDSDELLDLYRKISKIAPDTKHIVGAKSIRTIEWANWKSMRVLGEKGDYEKALTYLDRKNRFDWSSSGDRWGRVYAKRATEEAGEYPLTSELLNARWINAVQLSEDKKEVVMPLTYGSFFLVPPKGKLFQSLRVWPIARDKYNTVFQLNVQQVKRSDVFVTSSQYPQYHKMPESGYFVPSLPNSPFAELSLLGYAGIKPHDKDRRLEAVRVKAEFREIPEVSGRIEVICDNCDDFRIFEGKQMLRSGWGTIAYLTPGKHTLRFLPLSRAWWAEYRQRSTELVYGPFELEVEVKANQTTRIAVSFPWEDPQRFKGWETASVKPPEEAPLHVDLNVTKPDHRPQLLFEEDRIRLVWSEAGDIWTCESIDGKTFTKRRHLALPVSTAWVENLPRCRIDHLGRYVLAFRSDRNKDRVQRLYMSWSRDFMNWTAPRQIRDRYIEDYDFIKDPKSGRLILAEASGDKISLWKPDDFFQWQSLGEFSFGWPVKHLELLPPDRYGDYEIVAVQQGQPWKDHDGRAIGPNFCYSSRWLSRDLKTWKEDDTVRLEWAFDTSYELSAFRYKETQTMAMRFGTSPVGQQSSRCRLSWWKSGDGQAINRALIVSSVASHDSDLDWHPKWGAYLAWFSASSQPEHKPRGPFVVHGPDLSAWMIPTDIKKNSERLRPEFRPVIGGQAGSGTIQ